MDRPTTADEKALAMSCAYTALVRALCKSGAITQDDLMKELAGANMMLQRIGETEAAVFLGALAQSLQAIDD
jgi:hypothetical protein